MITNWRLEALTPEHTDQAAAIHSRCFPRPWDAPTLRAFLVNGQGLAALKPNPTGAMGGFLLYTRAADQADVVTLAVDPQQRRQRCAAHLLEALTAELRLQGVINVFLEIAVGNRAALALYHQQGFEKVSERLNYYKGATSQQRDALLMRKII